MSHQEPTDPVGPTAFITPASLVKLSDCTLTDFYPVRAPVCIYAWRHLCSFIFLCICDCECLHVHLCLFVCVRVCSVCSHRLDMIVGPQSLSSRAKTFSSPSLLVYYNQGRKSSAQGSEYPPTHTHTALPTVNAVILTPSCW